MPNNLRQHRKGWRPLDPPGDMPDATWDQSIKLETKPFHKYGFSKRSMELHNAIPKKPRDNPFRV